MDSFSQPHWPSWAYPGVSDQFSNYSQFPNYSGFLADSLEVYQNQHSRLVQQQQMSRTTESKPRLSKEEVEILEAEFQKNHKPTSTTKKALAESMRVDNARINNWFQNRRAREKKENNIREYEAKQQLDKERTDSGQGLQPTKSRQRDFVASSAPFPQPAASLKQHTDASLSPLDASVSDETSDAGQSSDSDSTSPLPLLLANKHEHVHTFDRGDEDNSSDQIEDYLAVQDNLMLNVSGGAPSQFFPGLAAIETIHPSVENYDNDIDVDLSTSSSPLADDYDVPSPHVLDIASRRNRRPAPLSIGGGRSNSYTTRAHDAAWKAGQAASMRRISSSTGSGRVTKSVATPRSPFFDGTAASLLQRLPSPRAAGRYGSAAPPTPDTPVTLQTQEPLGVPALYALNRKFTPQEVVISDPTLRTPPTTPGFSEGLFNFGSGYEISLSDEPLIASGMDRLHSSLGMSGNVTAFSDIMSNNNNQCHTQQIAPMYQAPLGQSYFGLVGSDDNADYSWSALQSSTAPLPSNTQQRYMSLNNMDN